MSVLQLFFDDQQIVKRRYMGIKSDGRREDSKRTNALGIPVSVVTSLPQTPGTDGEQKRVTGVV